ncbi:MAG: flavodoxin domain-containing protein, partial [Butyricicoccus sp.]
MSKVAVIFWSGTGNTELMANAIADGAKEAGAEVALLPVAATSADQAAGFDRLALGCPAMGTEVLEEMEFEPFFTELESRLSGKHVALFGSFGWGDGQWMRDWYTRTDEAGAVMIGDEGL